MYLLQRGIDGLNEVI